MRGIDVYLATVYSALTVGACAYALTGDRPGWVWITTGVWLMVTVGLWVSARRAPR